MAQTWFLDLDGVKSGPYQTTEILNLISEGEVHPHHRISSDLRSAPWSTILDWRLQQAKLVKPLIGETKSEAVTSIVFEEKPKVSTIPPPPHIQVTPMEHKPSQISSGPKRDPMAEMFDMLQKTKQKREEKQLITAQAQASFEAHHHRAIKKGLNGMWKTASAIIGITVLGFWLGQWFQKNAPPATPSITSVATPTPIKEESKKPPDQEAENNLDNAVAADEETPEDEVVDRSTEKMLIKGKVPRMAAATATVESKLKAAQAVPEKELKELQDLKKELLELKNLKDELKNSMNDDNYENGSDGNPDYNGANDVNNPNYPNHFTDPNIGRPTNNNNDVHY